ncbi:MAG: YggS family pyridoxal phosphate-dependent enzyme [Ignavibacteriales bacterium]|nr:YggS family pyridoxal phosphate-dependent enzyme [Ignavibacteriales bacterium]
MIANNIVALRNRIQKKCSECGRNVNEIKLIAVSKYFGIDAINQAIDAGISDFGENKAQELNLKFEKIGSKVTWHFIGNLQMNKVKYAVNCAEIIHSVDSFELAEEIAKKAEVIGKVQKILVQVKTSGEETKSGAGSEVEVRNILEFCKLSKNINTLGLMTMAPLTENEILIRKSFRDLKNLLIKFNSEGYQLHELSMGMTSDFEIAIEEGSTMLRIGSAIFGERDYSKKWNEL